MKFRDLTGLRFDRLVTLHKSSHRNGRITWACKCDCGQQIEILSKTLLNGRTRSCGCLAKETTAERNRRNGRPIGFERITAKGYVEIKTAYGFRRKHIHVMEVHLGRGLLADEVVHHKDRDKKNNLLSNLELMTHAEHTILHNVEGW